MNSKTFFKYVIPTILAMWVFSIYTLVDGFFVAHFVGPEAFAAVNLAMPVTNALFSFGILVSVGTSTRIGINLGKGRVDKANEIFSSVLFGAGLLALVTSILLMVLSSPWPIFWGPPATSTVWWWTTSTWSCPLPFSLFCPIFWKS